MLFACGYVVPDLVNAITALKNGLFYLGYLREWCNIPRLNLDAVIKRALRAQIRNLSTGTLYVLPVYIFLSKIPKNTLFLLQFLKYY